MSDERNNPAAFPYYTDRAETSQSGMTLRDYFAAAAMRGMLANPNIKPGSGLCPTAYDVADAMMKARIAE